MYQDGNQISPELREKLRNFQWSANSFLDLHSLGVHYWTPEYLPTWIDPMAYASLWRRGLTPPNALPIYTDENTHVRIKQFIDDNYHKLHLAGLPYLGNEANLQRAEDFDKKPIRMCFVRLSDYHTLDGAFGGQLINNFIQNFSDEVFADFSWIVAPSDVPKFMQAGLPIMFGNITKRPLTDFDIIVIATSYPGERVNAPLSLVRSGLPMYRWERFDDNLPYKKRCPLVTVAGIGASFIENLLADHPIKGCGQNALFDHCFTPDTLVLMADGSYKPIGKIEPGEEVATHDPDTGGLTSEPVTATQTFISDKPILELEFEHEGQIFTLRCTEDHEIYTVNRGKIEAKDLTEEDHILHY